MIRAWTAAATALAAAVMFVTVAAGSAATESTTPSRPAISVAELLDLATYHVHTISGDHERTTGALMAVPATVDVNGGLPDLLVEVLPTSGSSVTVLIDRIALTAVPAQVELVFDLPGGRGVTFGYDARASKTPTHFQTNLSFHRDDAGRTDVTTSLQVSGAGPALGLLTSLFERGDDGSQVDPTRARLDFTPVPGRLTASVVNDRAAGLTTAALTANAPATVDLDVQDTDGADTRHVTGTIDQLPTSVDVQVQADAGHDEVHYSASDPVAAVAVTADDEHGTQTAHLDATAHGVPTQFDLTADTTGTQQLHYTAHGGLASLTGAARTLDSGTVAREAVFDVHGLPDRIDVLRTGPKAATFSASAPISSIEAGLATGGAVTSPAEHGDYADLVSDDAGYQSAAVRVRGLHTAQFAADGQITASLDVARAPLHIHAEDPTRTADVTVADVPGGSRLTLSPDTGTLTYEGSDSVHLITADVIATQPFLGPATTAHVEVHDLPKTVTLRFGPSADPFEPPPIGPVITPRSDCEEIPGGAGCDPLPGDGGSQDDDDTSGNPPADPASDKSFVFDAHGATLGRLDVLLSDGTSTPAIALDPCDPDGTVADVGGIPNHALCEDGVLVEDQPGHFVVQGRITGLRLAGVRLTVADKRLEGTIENTRVHQDVAHLGVDPDVNGGRPVRVFLDHGSERVLADVSNLPRAMTLHLDSQDDGPLGAGRSTVTYDASAKIDRIHAQAQIGRLPHPLLVTVQDVPTHFSFCYSQHGVCHDTLGAHPVRDHGTVEFAASDRVTLDAFLCLAANGPTVGPCDTQDEANSFVKVANMKAQVLREELHVGDLTEEDPLVVRFDTDGLPVTGALTFRDDEATVRRFVFPDESTTPQAITIPLKFGASLDLEWSGALAAEDLDILLFKDLLHGIVGGHVLGRLGCGTVDHLTLRIPVFPNFDILQALKDADRCL